MKDRKELLFQSGFPVPLKETGDFAYVEDTLVAYNSYSVLYKEDHIFGKRISISMRTILINIGCIIEHSM